MSSNIIIKKSCEQCGKVFEAKTSVTRFCSLKCNNKNLKLRKRGVSNFQQQKVTRKKVNHTLADLTSMEFLSVPKAAKLMDVSKRIVYNLINSGRLRATNISVRKTIIARIDIDAFFDRPDGTSGKALNPNYCRMAEAAVIFNISESALFEIIKRNELPKFKEGKYTYIAKSDLEKIFNTGGSHA